MEAGIQRLRLWETEESNVTKPKPLLFFTTCWKNKMTDEDPQTY